MTAAEILKQLQSLGSDSTKKTLLRHGAREPFYGVKVEDLKKVQKQIKNNQELALELYDTGVSDAMYLAGLVANGAKMTKKQLQSWAEKAYWSQLSEYTVPWVASESPYGYELALQWIDSDKENIASAGWNTLSSLVAVTPDEELDIKGLKALLGRVEKNIHKAPNRVRYTMNGFVIAVGSYVPALTDAAMATAGKIGTVSVNMGDTACKVPSAPEYIKKIKDMGRVGKKRKTAKC